MTESETFSPAFSFTKPIVDSLVRIAASREIVLHARLIPKWEVSLRRDQILRAAHASTAIEGNPLTLEEVSRLADGREVMASRKAQAEVLNYLSVLEHIEMYHARGTIDREAILTLHRDVTKGTLDDPSAEGRYRTVPVVVGNRITGEVVYTAPPPEEVPLLMDTFLAWLNGKEASETDPVLVAGIAHYEMVRIHPFVDGNGRVARALATLILFLREFDIKRFFTLDDYYDSDRNAYYEALKSENDAYPDLTPWLGYFTEGVSISLHRVQERVLRLSRDEHLKGLEGQIALTDRQMRIIDHLHRNGSITTGECAKMFRISRQAALKELGKLVEHNLIVLEGKGRASRYVLV
jgi:Fic family protein